MITTSEAKALARELARAGGPTHSQVLEAAAHAAGFRDWNTFVAVSRTAPATASTAPAGAIPVLRVFDHELARDFYCGLLGFTHQWQHQFEPDLPVYAAVERAGTVLHLSEHHGDASPGGTVMIPVADVAAYHRELSVQSHRNARPGIDDNPWGRTMTVTDPFSNRLIFWQRP